jgi:hypothetical protein
MQNRLLSMIRQQQAQIDTLTAGQQQPSNSAVDDSTPTSERSMSLSRSQSQAAHAHAPASAISPLPSAAQPRSRSPFNISRQSSFADRSRGGSHAGSPALRPFPGAPHEAHEMLPSPATGRDESAFYQAETQNLTRENQMLKLRIRELGRSHVPTFNCMLTCYRATAGRAEPYKPGDALAGDPLEPRSHLWTHSRGIFEPSSISRIDFFNGLCFRPGVR